MTIAVKLLNDQIKKISSTNTLLDMLLEFEKTLDSMDMYAFANWDQGEVLTGPDLDRHFITVKLMYPGEQMPDPEGAKRLLARECMVKYRKDTLLKPRKVRNFDDLMVDTRPDGSTRYKAKTDATPVWVVEIKMPRRYVDEFDADRVAVDIDAYVDLEDAGVDAQLQVTDQSADQIPADVAGGVI
jgi:hypothetical protein